MVQPKYQLVWPESAGGKPSCYMTGQNLDALAAENTPQLQTGPAGFICQNYFDLVSSHTCELTVPETLGQQLGHTALPIFNSLMTKPMMIKAFLSQHVHSEKVHIHTDRIHPHS